MKNSLLPIGLMAVTLACGPATPPIDTTPSDHTEPTTVACPNGKGIVTLTYDDGLASQLENALPALDAHGFKATFFLNEVSSNPSPWAAAARQGHELGAHTFNHPCTAAFDWVPPGKASEDYDTERMVRELADQIAALEAMGQRPPLSFAYPCGTTWMGPEHTSYIPLVEERFIAARGVDARPFGPADTLTNVPAHFIEGPADALIAAAAPAVNGKAWVVFGFHGIGGDHLSVSIEDHDALLDYLDAHRADVAVLPFGTAARCLAL